ncbi:LysR family transcriptional regulator [Mycobacterium colombiense]|nr:LysR family transcriptional regulator [Mycobacterium colombiense]
MAGLDVSQLRALHALLTERSVSGAAARLGRSQPTLSNSLARLRRHFGNELLSRSGNHYVLTPFAQQLLILTDAAVAAVDRVFAAEADFEPRNTTREYTVVSSDHGISVVGGPLVTRILQHAPEARLRFVPVTPAVIGREADFYRTVDGVFMPDGYLGLPRRLEIYEDRWVCVVASDNPRVAEHLTMQDLNELPWVTAFLDPFGKVPPWRQMELLGVVPRVCAAAGSFLAIPRLLKGTAAIALLQSRVADIAAAGPEFRILECPFDPVPLVESFWWHPVHDDDPAHQWLRRQLAELSQEL